MGSQASMASIAMGASQAPQYGQQELKKAQNIEALNADLLGQDINDSVQSFKLGSNGPQTRYEENENADAPQDKQQLRSLGMTPKRLESTCPQTQNQKGEDLERAELTEYDDTAVQTNFLNSAAGS